MKYIVIGLSNYGLVLTKELTERGHDVICADSNASELDKVKNHCVAAYQLDCTDELALKQTLPIQKVDVVIVAIGRDLGASIRVVALLKKLGAQHIFARALDEVHKGILEAFNIDRILTPESYAAYALVTEMDFGSLVTTFSAGPERRIFKFNVPETFLGLTLGQFNLEGDYHLQLIEIVKGVNSTNSLGHAYIKRENMDEEEKRTHKLTANDQFVCYGSVSDFLKFAKRMK